MLTDAVKFRKFVERRSFIGGSDARIIMGSDEAALIRLWREKRGEAEPEDLSGNLIVQLGTATEDLNRSWYERNSGRSASATSSAGSSTPPFPGWRPPSMASCRELRPCSRLNSCCPGRSPGDGRRKVYGPAPTQHVGDPPAELGAFNHHRRWQMGGDHHPHGPALSQREAFVLTLSPTCPRL